MSLYNELIPLGLALAVFDDEITKSRLETMTEAEKEELMNRAKDTKSGDELDAILNEISANEHL